jgi:hypothetical protein
MVWRTSPQENFNRFFNLSLVVVHPADRAAWTSRRKLNVRYYFSLWYGLSSDAKPEGLELGKWPREPPWWAVHAGVVLQASDFVPDLQHC